jgi:hypothetical protein
MQLHSRASSNATIKMIMSNANGIGSSKADAKRESSITGQNGQSISSKAHSIKSTQNLRTVVTQYVNHVKAEYGGRVVKNINQETIKEFINNKIENGLSLAAANTYISELAKMSDNLNQLGVNSTSRADIVGMRGQLIEKHGTMQSPKVDRTNKDPIAIINSMNANTPYGVSSELQVMAGLRRDDAINLDKLTINQNNTITVNGSKNGLNYTTKVLPETLINRVSEAQNMGYRVNKDEYSQTLKDCVEDTNQVWKGSHSLRYDYANMEHGKNIENGIPKDESISQIALNMGHSRSEITNHYLKGE